MVSIKTKGPINSTSATTIISPLPGYYPPLPGIYQPLPGIYQPLPGIIADPILR